MLTELKGPGPPIVPVKDARGHPGRQGPRPPTALAENLPSSGGAQGINGRNA
jgi:hypothetical protein